MVIFYCIKTFKSIPRHQDFCTQLTQKDAQIPSYVVVIFHNYNREISENGEDMWVYNDMRSLVRIDRSSLLFKNRKSTASHLKDEAPPPNSSKV